MKCSSEAWHKKDYKKKDQGGKKQTGLFGRHVAEQSEETSHNKPDQ